MPKVTRQSTLPLIPSGLALSLALGACSGCGDGRVVQADPKLIRGPAPIAPVAPPVPDKVDILFDIDNSSGMADKQRYLAEAIPELLAQIPVHDLHVGIVTSSLGPRGGDVCQPTSMAPLPFGNVSAHDDDRAHLVNRTLAFAPDRSSVTEGTVTDAPASDPYLYWFPSAPNVGQKQGAGNPIQSASTLATDFTAMATGTGEFGCGIESQLESWYRFLIQPDPYASIGTTGEPGNAMGQWVGVDTTILQERHDFLRPDSVVLIVDVSDENDSEIDVRSIGGLGVNWMAGAFQPPSGTAACSSTPGTPACQSCAQGSNAKNDSQCQQKPNYTAIDDWGYDLNLRHVHMKQKYGVDPQYPIERYVTGLTSTSVPDRNGEYPSGATSYVGMNDCQNPLFSGALPDGSKTDATSLCHTPPGTRTKDLVFYAHIGGVPSGLLHFDPKSTSHSTLVDADWVKILGNNPEAYDYTGIDPHMIESYQPRSGLPGPGSANDADPVSGHEWVTTSTGGVQAIDLEYACTFPLVDATGAPSARDCTLAQNANSCACPHTAGSVTTEQLPPVCDQTTITKQTGAKAYPTIRELLLARKMGRQGIVSSICPIDVADATGTDPLYGYRPAVAGIIDRLKDALTNQCLPQRLAPDPKTQEVPCLILLQVPGGANGTGGSCLNPTCPVSFGLQVPDASVRATFCGSLEDEYNSQVSANNGSNIGLTDPAGIPVCELRQLVPTVDPTDFQYGTCAASTNKGWCYVTGAAAGKCPESIVFANNAIPFGAFANLQCLDPGLTVTLDGG